MVIFLVMGSMTIWKDPDWSKPVVIPEVFVHVELLPVVVFQVVTVQLLFSPVRELPVVLSPVSEELLPVVSAFAPNIISPKLAKISNPSTFFCLIIFVYIIKSFLHRVDFIRIYTMH